MRSFLRSLWLSLGLVTLAASGANAAMAPGVGPDSSWTDAQKFEWYLGYMSAASALCNDFSRASELSDIASLSPYGRVGLGSINFDGFIGGACPKIRKRAVDLLKKKESYIRYLSAAYDCGPDGKCPIVGSSDMAPEHACAKKVDEHLDALSLKSRDIASISIKDGPQTSDRRTAFQARVRLKSCSGSLYVDMSKQCALRKSYTRGDCDVAGVSGF